MLQFDANATKKNAVYIETVNTASNYYGDVAVIFSQSYDNSNSIGDATVISTPTTFRHWLVFSNLGSTVPTSSGQYDVEIWTRQPGIEGRWGFTDQVWGTTPQVWNSFGDAGALVDKIYEDRAYVVGTNNESITQYVSPDETGTYTTYNG